MKTVYTGNEVPHIFATRPDAIARNANRTLSCEGGTLYSYRAPIAAWHNGKILISTEKHSVTTSKHQSWVRYAVRHLESVYLPDLRNVLGNRSRNGAAAYIVKRAKEIDALREKAGRARSEWRKAGLAGEIAQLETACAYVWRDMAGQRTPWESAITVDQKARDDAAKARYARARNELEAGLENAARILDGAQRRIERDGAQGGLSTTFYCLENAQRDIRYIDSMGAARGLGALATATFTDAARLMGKKWAKDCMTLAQAIVAVAESMQPEIDAARAAFDAERRATESEKIAAWLAGERVAYPHDLPVACRVIGGDTVETSRGARVPLADALHMAGLARACRDAGRGMDLRGVAVGQYAGTRIDSTGTLVVGCHSIPWESIADAVARHEGRGE
jgi:hypothetical protein